MHLLSQKSVSVLATFIFFDPNKIVLINKLQFAMCVDFMSNLHFKTMQACDISPDYTSGG